SPVVCSQDIKYDYSSEKFVSFGTTSPRTSFMFDGEYSISLTYNTVSDGEKTSLATVQSNIADLLGKSARQMEEKAVSADTRPLQMLDSNSSNDRYGMSLYVKNNTANLWDLNIESVGDQCMGTKKYECLDQAGL